MGYFFGEKALTRDRGAAKGSRASPSPIFTTSPSSRSAARRRPLGVAEAYCIYKGRKLLKAFNEGGVSGGSREWGATHFPMQKRLKTRSRMSSV